MADIPLDHPPFPSLEWRDDDWESAVALAAWSGYSIRSSPEGLRYGKSDGTFNLLIMTTPDPTTPRPAPTSAQTAAFNFLLKNQQEIQSAILEALLPFYNERRPDYREFLGRDFKLLMPKAADVAIFRELIKPGAIYLHSVEKDRMGYTGFSFGSSWEVEHGLGFILHGDRIVKVGEAEIAFHS